MKENKDLRRRLDTSYDDLRKANNELRASNIQKDTIIRELQNAERIHQEHLQKLQEQNEALARENAELKARVDSLEKEGREDRNRSMEMERDIEDLRAVAAAWKANAAIRDAATALDDILVNMCFPDEEFRQKNKIWYLGDAIALMNAERGKYSKVIDEVLRYLKYGDMSQLESLNNVIIKMKAVGTQQAHLQRPMWGRISISDFTDFAEVSSDEVPKHLKGPRDKERMLDVVRLLAKESTDEKFPLLAKAKHGLK